MTYTLPQHNTSCALATRLTDRHLVVTLRHDGTDLDRILYARQGTKIRVPGPYAQDETGACQHAAAYWFVRPPVQ